MPVEAVLVAITTVAMRVDVTLGVKAAVETLVAVAVNSVAVAATVVSTAAK